MTTKTLQKDRKEMPNNCKETENDHREIQISKLQELWVTTKGWKQLQSDARHKTTTGKMKNNHKEMQN